MSSNAGQIPLGSNRFRRFLQSESVRNHKAYVVRAFALEALAHSQLPNPTSFGQLEAFRTNGHFLASREVAERVWTLYLRWIEAHDNGGGAA
jgi:hypothetical protein